MDEAEHQDLLAAVKTMVGFASDDPIAKLIALKTLTVQP
jgi:hypothetical protein